MEKFVDKLGRELTLHRLYEKDFKTVDEFYKREMAALAVKEYFYPYTKEELQGIVSKDGGYFFGVFYRGELVGTLAVDLDAEYGKELAKRIETDLYPIYELSGFFVSEKFRGSGVADILMTKALSYAKEVIKTGYLVSVVEHTNVKSLKKMEKFGFTLVKTLPFDNKITFSYLIKKIA